ncbi:MAG: ABC transporter ATP-binding protein [Gemmatimonadaceae bacterium]
MPPTAPLLDVRNLEVVYSDVILVLRGISLRVDTGSVVALLGANGAGKTTLLRAITGLLDVHRGDVTKGEIAIDGEAVHRRSPASIVRRGIAQVMEGRRIFPELSVEDNLVAGAFTVGDAAVRRARRDAMFVRFPVLATRRQAIAGYLSGGEQQMLAIARALMSAPRLLLLDEPSLGLAPRMVAQVGEIIQQVHADGTAVLLVEQNAAMALGVSSFAYVLEHGKIVKEGTSEALRRDQDIREFYLGMGEATRSSFRDVKTYRRKKRWSA